MVNQSHGPYNLPPANQDVDDLTYNPQADAHFDNDAFDGGDGSDIHPVGARGADNEPTYRDYQKEDRDAERSEVTGRIPKGEAHELVASTTQDERKVSGYTRGKHVDAFKQERDIDRIFDETGVSSAEQDV